MFLKKRSFEKKKIGKPFRKRKKKCSKEKKKYENLKKK
jgi:hypothetical protein